MPGLFEAINPLGRDVAIPRGALLFGCGDPASAVHILRNGTISLFVSLPQDEVHIDTLPPGSIIGLPASFNGHYSTGAEALEDCEAGLLNHDRFLELLEGNRALLPAATRMIAEETAKMRGLIASAWEIAGPRSATRPRGSLQNIRRPRE
jgi:CRP-like cAMP-binding protein